jgi:hypothetical protein
MSPDESSVGEEEGWTLARAGACCAGDGSAALLAVPALAGGADGGGALSEFDDMSMQRRRDRGNRGFEGV